MNKILFYFSNLDINQALNFPFDIAKYSYIYKQQKQTIKSNFK
jgi:hypothetical protein